MMLPPIPVEIVMNMLEEAYLADSQDSLRKTRRIRIVLQADRPVQMLTQILNNRHVGKTVNIRRKQHLGARPVMRSRNADAYLAHFGMQFLQNFNRVDDGIQNTTPTLFRSGNRSLTQKLFPS